MAFTIVVLARLVKFKPMSHVRDGRNFHDLGKLMFAFVLLWAYFSVSQLLIIWSANLPEEIPFYLERLHGPWAPVSIARAARSVRPAVRAAAVARPQAQRPAAWRWVALFILVMRVVDIAWMIGPVFRHEGGSGLHWLDFAMVLGMGGIWLFLFFRNLAGRALVPGARSVSQGSNGSWRTLNTPTRPRSPDAADRRRRHQLQRHRLVRGDPHGDD